MVTLPIYMDNNSTTRTDPRVVDAMLPYFTEKYGNAASRSHPFGWEGEAAVEEARDQIAELIGASGKEIIFTSGATEAANLAHKGVAAMYKKKGNHFITTAIEHKCVLDPLKRLEREGCSVTVLPVDKFGRVSAEQVRAALTDKTVLVSVMFANNEIGTINPIADIGKVCKEKGVLFHTDAVQAVGKVPVDVNAIGIDLLSLSGHKIYGPKGVGALYVRKKDPRVRLEPQIDGGGHERGMRSGTLAVPLHRRPRGGLRHRPPGDAGGEQEDVRPPRAAPQGDHGPTARVVPERPPDGASARERQHFSFAYVEGEGLMMGIKDVAVSSGSACTSASLEPSYVLRALGVGDELAHSSIRFGLGRFNTEARRSITWSTLVVREVSRLREMSPLFEMVQQGIDITKIEWAAH